MKLKIFFLCLLITNSVLFCNPANSHKTQKAHLAGSWYPANKVKLTKNLEHYFALANKYFKSKDSYTVSAIIAPHAGYKYSGLCAAAAYQTIKDKSYDRVIILAPAHAQNFYGIALPNVQEYQTPLGTIPVDSQALSILQAQTPLFKTIPDIYQKEHSLEIQLPFLQFCLKNFSLVPLIIGKLSEKDFKTVAKTLKKLLSNNKKTLIIISSDFTHYGERFGYTPSFANAITSDITAVEAILKTSYQEFNSTITKTKATICGKNPIKILLKLIAIGALGSVECTLASYYNSAQIKTKNNQVTGLSKLSQVTSAKNFVCYAGLVCRSKLSPQEKQVLLKLARNAITEQLLPDKKLDNNFEITENLKTKSGVFVTLHIQTKRGKKLRGCIGNITSNTPLYKLVPKIAQSSAFRDPRFSPITKKELDTITISITVLTPPEPIKSYHDIVIGKHGVTLEKIVDKTKKGAVFLPQVAPGEGWDVPTMLEHLSIKAGLPKDAWQDKDCKFKVFEGFEFGE